jgi:putative aminopeptidase FrvX
MDALGKIYRVRNKWVAICAKDSATLWLRIISKLVKNAEENHLSYASDIYPYYGSDVSAAYRGVTTSAAD